ncbi:hypothetical protein BTJ_4029 [Burkholderia thailandensis E444]|nr:hypothetical protein BTJ_4029 [Burkholderia thailandensis E444]
MRVRAARAERRHARDARPSVEIRFRPRRERALQHERRAREIEVGIRFVRMQRRHELAMLHLQQHLRYARDARRALAMADVRLDRAERAEAAIAGCFGERAREARELDRIAERGAGAVRLDVADRARGHAASRERRGDDRLLRARVRHREAVRLAARVDHAAADDAVDRVAVGERARQRLEHEHADALAVDEAVRTRAERAARVARREHRQRRQPDQMLRTLNEIDAARERAVAGAAAQAVEREMDRGQRRRARGVDGEARPVQIERVRHAVRDAPELRARRVVAVHHADEHADLAVRAERRRRVAGVFDRGPRFLEEQAALRIDVLRVARRDPEERGVEAVDLLQEAAPAAVRAARRAFFRIEVRAPVPSLGGHFGDAVAARAEIRPELAQVVRLRVAAGHADDGDGGVGGGCGCGRCG